MWRWQVRHGDGFGAAADELPPRPCQDAARVVACTGVRSENMSAMPSEHSPPCSWGCVCLLLLTLLVSRESTRGCLCSVPCPGGYLSQLLVRVRLSRERARFFASKYRSIVENNVVQVNSVGAAIPLGIFVPAPHPCSVVKRTWRNVEATRRNWGLGRRKFLNP